MEQPIFTTKAHVFQIDPETKKNWIPASKQAINVSYYYDSTRNTYRIISVEGSKAIINSTITSGMTFTKTSQKFGQWSDPRANTVYGLGFSTEADLAKFIDKFKEIKDLSRKSIATKPSEQNGTDEENSHSPERRVYHQRTSSLSTIQGDVGGFVERRGSLTGNSSPPSPVGITEGQLKYENDRLKIALAQSSANAKKWEIELQTLKNNNARLTAALQESTANVEEWKKQLASYKEESSRMKAKVMDMEKLAGNAEQIQTLQQEIRLMTEKMESLTKEISKKEDDIKKFEKKVDVLAAKEAQIVPLKDNITSLETENEAKSLKIQDLQRLLSECRSSHEEEEKEVLGFQDLLGRRITELYELHEQIVSTIKKESQS